FSSRRRHTSFKCDWSSDVCSSDLDVLDGLDIAAPADHVFPPGELHQSRADIVVTALYGLDYSIDRDFVSQQLVGIDVDLVLAHEAAHGGYFRYARNRLQGITQIPVLEALHVRQAILLALIDERILIDPTNGRVVLRQLRLNPLREPRQNRIQVLQGARTRPVKVGPFIKNHVYVGIAKVGERTNVFHLGHAQQCGDDGIADLVLHDVRAAVPLAVD